MTQVNQMPVRSRSIGIHILTLFLAAQGALGVVAIVRTYLALSNAGISLGTALSDSTFRSGFYLIVIAAVVSLVLALAYWLIRRWTFWLILLAELVALFFGAIAIAINSLDWYIIPVFVALPVVILVYMFADRNVRASRKRG